MDMALRGDERGEHGVGGCSCGAVVGLAKLLFKRRDIELVFGYSLGAQWPPVFAIEFKELDPFDEESRLDTEIEGRVRD